MTLGTLQITIKNHLPLEALCQTGLFQTAYKMTLATIVDHFVNFYLYSLFNHVFILVDFCSTIGTHLFLDLIGQLMSPITM